jgi:hypothetical protein
MAVCRPSSRISSPRQLSQQLGSLIQVIQGTLDITQR